MGNKNIFSILRQCRIFSNTTENLHHTGLRVLSVGERCNYFVRSCWRMKSDRPIIWYRQRSRDGVAVKALGDTKLWVILNATVFYSLIQISYFCYNVLAWVSSHNELFLVTFVSKKYFINNEINLGSMRKTHTFVNLVLGLRD